MKIRTTKRKILESIIRVSGKADKTPKLFLTTLFYAREMVEHNKGALQMFLGAPPPFLLALGRTEPPQKILTAIMGRGGGPMSLRNPMSLTPAKRAGMAVLTCIEGERRNSLLRFNESIGVSFFLQYR